MVDTPAPKRTDPHPSASREDKVNHASLIDCCGVRPSRRNYFSLDCTTE